MRIFVTLECNHVNEYVDRDFSVGDERMCTRCNRVGRIVQIDAQYSYNCATCHTGRSYGMSLLTCERGAGAHIRKYPDHTVQLRAGIKILRILTGKISQKPFDIPF